jgi:hypothetical protein
VKVITDGDSPYDQPRPGQRGRGRAGPSAGARTGHVPVCRDPGYLTETGQAAGEDGSTAPVIGGLPAVEGPARDTGAPRDERGADLAEELGSSPGPPSREDTQQPNHGRPTTGPDMTAPPERLLARACLAGAQVASRRKAHHGSSRTVFHDGSGQARGTLTHRPGVERESGQCYSSRGSHHRLDASGRGQMRSRQAAPGTTGPGTPLPAAWPGRPFTAGQEGPRLFISAGRRVLSDLPSSQRVTADRLIQDWTSPRLRCDRSTGGSRES